MIDMHCHILPGCDDGAAFPEDSLAMARGLAAAGFSRVVATPHLQEGLWGWDDAGERLLPAVEALQKALREEAIPLEVLPGAEVRYTQALLPRLSQGKALPTLGGTDYLLLELSLLHPAPPAFEQDLFLLQARGCRPVLAHPERCLCFLEEPHRLTALALRGVLFQVNLGSLTGCFGEESRRLALWLLRSGVVNFFGTDAHRPGDERIGAVPAALGVMQREVGERETQRLTSENARQALAGGHLEQQEPRQGAAEAAPLLSRPSFFKKMFRKGR